MKSTVTHVEKSSMEIVNYPCIGIDKKNGTIVLFHDKKCGVVINGITGPWMIGHYSATWHMDSFIVYNDGITLSN